MFVTSLELARLVGGAARLQWIGETVEGHCRNSDVGAASETILKRLQRRIAGGKAEGVPVSVNDNIGKSGFSYDEAVWAKVASLKRQSGDHWVHRRRQRSVR